MTPLNDRPVTRVGINGVNSNINGRLAVKYRKSSLQSLSCTSQTLFYEKLIIFHRKYIEIRRKRWYVTSGK